jgi:ElaB/YqjD/DUF883 family membrane-anchored ribosome-binding protein
MINPNGDDFVEDNPMAAPAQSSAAESATEQRSTRMAGNISAAAGETWKQARDRAGNARARTKVFVRENPLPVIVGALAFGLAIGWALRHATREEKEAEIKTPLGDFNWSFLSVPFLWPFLKSMKGRYHDSAESLRDAARGGMQRMRKIDVDRYAKPLRKRWKSWTH